MATFLPPAPPVPGEVPPELLSLADATWADPLLFAAWLRRHDLGESTAVGWFHSFCTARDRWAAANGFWKTTGRTGHRSRDDARLQAVGIPFAGSLLRAMAKAGHPAPERPIPYPLSDRDHRVMLAAWHAEHGGR